MHGKQRAYHRHHKLVISREKNHSVLFAIPEQEAEASCRRQKNPAKTRLKVGESLAGNRSSRFTLSVAPLMNSGRTARGVLAREGNRHSAAIGTDVAVRRNR